MNPSAQVDEWVRASIEGDAHAFACLLEREAHAVYRATLAIVGSPDDASDVIQEAAIRAWQQLSALHDPAAWGPWFRRIAVRTAIERTRRASRSREVTMTQDIEPSYTDSTEDVAEHATIMMALARLAPDDRAVLGLRFGGDLTVPDIASTLNIRLGTAKARLHRALQRLRKEIGEDDVR